MFTVDMSDGFNRALAAIVRVISWLIIQASAVKFWLWFGMYYELPPIPWLLTVLLIVTWGGIVGWQMIDPFLKRSTG